jgi:hypothetical protein
MTETKETLRKVMNVSQTLGGDDSKGQFNVNMIVDFAPDIVIVRQVSFYSTAGDQKGVYNVVNQAWDTVLGSVIDPSCTSPNTIIKLGKHVNQTQTFKIFRAGLTSIASALTGDLSITLEFVKYNDTSKKVGIEAF